MANFVKLTDITILPNRQRREHDHLKHLHLVESITTNGLINAINTRLDDKGNHILVAGERRLKAITDVWELGGAFKYAGCSVPEGTVPVIPLGDLSPLESEVLELEENIRRVDLTWQEEVAATARIAEIRETQAISQGKEKPSRLDLAEEIKGERALSQAQLVSKELLLARNLSNPLVSAAATKQEAYKALIRQDTLNRNSALAKTIGETLQSTRHKIYQIDCFAWMKDQPSAQFDLVLTDPPYGMGADSFGDSSGHGGIMSGNGGHFYKDDADMMAGLLDKLPQELYRLAKPDAHLYLFCDLDWFHQWKSYLKAAGWNVFRTPIIWYSPSKFRAPWPEHGPQRKYEIILFARKGNKKCTRLYGDVVECSPDANLCHQAQKPVGLFSNLMQRSCVPGEVVFDPFAGTGPVFEAAQELNCYAVGCEMDSAAFGIAASRIKRMEDIK